MFIKISCITSGAVNCFVSVKGLKRKQEFKWISHNFKFDICSIVGYHIAHASAFELIIGSLVRVIREI